MGCGDQGRERYRLETSAGGRDVRNGSTRDWTTGDGTTGDWTTADPDRVDAVADEITTLSAHIHAATHRLLVLIAEFDRLKGWERDGHRSCAHWLAFRTGIALGAAREKVRAARALEDLPGTSAAMARGALSFAKVRALTRVATAENEGDLLELAGGSTAADLERMVRGWRLATARDEADLERIRHRTRTLSVFPGDDGMYVVRGRLDPEVGALLMRAVEAASDALYHAGREGARAHTKGNAAAAASAAGTTVGPTPTSATPEEITSEQRRADALGLLAERAMAAGFGGGDQAAGFGGGDQTAGLGGDARGVPRTVQGGRTGGQDALRDCDTGAARSAADVSAETSGRGDRRRAAPISGTRAERYQVLLHVEAAALARTEDPDGLARAEERDTLARAGGHGVPSRCNVPLRSHLHDGTRISAETSRRLACDASVVEVRHGGAARILDVGRRTRTIPPALRRALEVRDRGCRFPGCGLRFTDAHHVVHWADGGETKLDNLVLLCRHHHRLLHEEGFRVELNAWEGGRPVFYDRRGLPVPDVPPAMETEPRAVEALMRANRRRGTDPDWRTASCRWPHGDDIPLDILERAEEAA